MTDKIIALDDLVERDQKESVKAWILWMCEEAIRAHKITSKWDGESIEGEPVLAFVNNGRWLARCKVCNNPMYVSPKTPVFYCPECGNGGSDKAWGVEFPEQREQIEAELMRRPMELADQGKLIRNGIEWALHARPVVPGLSRSWRPGISVETLRDENEEAFKPKTRRRG